MALVISELEHYNAVYSHVPKVDRRGVPFEIGSMVAYSTATRDESVKVAEVVEIWTGPYSGYGVNPPSVNSWALENNNVNTIIKIRPVNGNRTLWRTTRNLVSLHGQFVPEPVEEIDAS